MDGKEEGRSIEGAKVRTELDQNNPVLRPDSLASVVPEWGNFIQGSGQEEMVWWREGSPLVEMEGKYDHVVVMLSGISSAGKNRFMNALQEKYPDLFARLVTATSRPMRLGEKDGVDYHFVTKQEFQEMIAEDELLEWKTQRSNHEYYGMPKSSVATALKQDQPVVCSLTELSGWDEVEEKIGNEFKGQSVAVVRVFVLPEKEWSEYSGVWIEGQRPSDHQDRVKRAIWELAEAPKKAHAVIGNRFGDDARFDQAVEALARVIQIPLKAEKRVS